MMRPLKNLCAALLLGLLSLGFAVLAAEAFCRFGLHNSNSRRLGASHHFRAWNSTGIQAVSPPLEVDQAPDEPCRFTDLIRAHPYLAVVQSQPCGANPLTRAHTESQNPLPFQRSKDAFRILVIGGSVAHQFANFPSGESWLEKILNQRFEPPKGDRFVVIGGAGGGWYQPRQLIMVGLYGNSVDGIINIDGYNDALAITTDHMMEQPNPLNYFSTHKQLSTLPIDFLLKISGGLYRLAIGSILEHSFFIYDLFASLVGVVESYVLDNPNNQFNEALYNYFKLPEDWTTEQRYEWNLDRYESMSRQTAAMSEAIKVKYAHFLQPIRWISKELTD